MPKINTKTARIATTLHYEDYGKGRPVVLIHGWPLSGRMWEAQQFALLKAGYRVVTYDRRGFGASDKPAGDHKFGYEYDTFADDLHDLLEVLDLQDVTLVGFSMGGGEVARYTAKYGTARVRSAVLLASVCPFLLSTADNAGAMAQADVDGMAGQVAAARIGFLSEFSKMFYGWEEFGTRLGESFLSFSQALAWQASPVATVACVHAFSETDFREDLAKLDKPTLVLHGDNDVIVPLEKSGAVAAELLPKGSLKVIKGAPHGLTSTHADEVNAALLEFLGK